MANDLDTPHVNHAAKAVYYPDPLTGDLRLARVHVFGYPVYSDAAGAADPARQGKPKQRDKQEAEADTANAKRAARRARRNAFDLIMCNPDLDAFVTLTYSPDTCNKQDYSDCYKYLRAWLSNGVQRDGLRYICVSELTKAQDVHFHVICNSAALRLDPAVNPHTGRAVRHHGDPVFNVRNWGAGFSTAQLIRQRKTGEDTRAAVAKYMFKYMTKQLGAKIGGRYFLHGGRLVEPVAVFGDAVEDFAADYATRAAVWSTDIDMGSATVKYTEYDFLSGYRGT